MGGGDRAEHHGRRQDETCNLFHESFLLKHAVSKWITIDAPRISGANSEFTVPMRKGTIYANVELLKIQGVLQLHRRIFQRM
jgi:hypothetical protein